MTNMKVMKFGGTSVGKPERMRQVAQLITADQTPKIVVLSALSGTTNALVEIGNACAVGDKQQAKASIEALELHYRQFIPALLTTRAARVAAEKIIQEHFEFLHIILKISFNEALNKDILAQGELLSTKLFSVYLSEIGQDHVLLPALDFMVIDAHDEPMVPVISERLKALLEQNPHKPLYITQGYICKNARNEVDNLKRGGSDYTASLVAAAIQAEVCEIWTDIDGMHNNDPRVVDQTRPIEYLSFDEAAELAYFGAKILHPASIWPAQHYNVPVKLLNTMEPQAKGTTIAAASSASGPKAVAAKDGIIVIHIKSSRMLMAYGFLRKIFEVFEKYRTPIDMITTSEVAVSLTIDHATHLDEIARELAPFGAIEIEKEMTIISIVGNEIAQQPAFLADLFGAIAQSEIRMISYGGSPHNVSLLIHSSQKKQMLQQINKGVFHL